MLKPIAWNNPLIVVGATGVGKTQFVLRVAEYFLSRGYVPHIVNIDSRQVYRDFPILSAQPTEWEQKAVAHHYYGYLPADATVRAGAYVKDLRSFLYSLRQTDNAVPIIVGGTGLYISGFCQGFSEIPTIPSDIQNSVRAYVEKDVLKAFERLQRYDPLYTDRITNADTQKIARALEVYVATGTPFSEWHRKQNSKRSSYVLLGIDIPMQSLAPALLHRIHSMIEQGAIDEVLQADTRYPTDDCPGFSTIGVKEIKAYTMGVIDRENMIEQWYKATRLYAKRQRTWFRNKTRPMWIDTALTIENTLRQHCIIE